MVREHRDGAISLPLGAVHVLNEVAPEIPVLKPNGVAGLLQHPGNPGRPVSISFVEAYEKVSLVVWIIHRLSATVILRAVRKSFEGAFKIVLGRRPLQRDALAGPFLQGRAIGRHRLLEPRRPALAT